MSVIPASEMAYRLRSGPLPASIPSTSTRPFFSSRGHRRADLAVVQWPVVTELFGEGPLEVVAVVGARTPGALGVCD